MARAKKATPKVTTAVLDKIDAELAARAGESAVQAAVAPYIRKPTLFKHYSEIPDGAWRWRNFPPAEIACRGTGEILVDPDALDALQALRSHLGKPVMVNSAYRSARHNQKVKGAKNSQHLYGRAFDISMSNHDPHVFEAASRAAGFQGFGRYPRQNFMHVDMGPARIWGDDFPTTATPFPVEPPPVREDLDKSRTINGAKIAAGGIAVSEIVESPEVSQAIDKAHSWSSVLPDGSTLKWILLGIAAIGLALVVYARWDDFKKGKR